MSEHILQGIGVSGGVAIAPLFTLPVEEDATRAQMAPEGERQALQEAIAAAAASLARLIKEVPDDAAAMLEFQAVLLEDEDLLAPIFGAIDAGEAADQAWRTTLNQEIELYLDSDTGDETFAARASDLADLRDRVLASLFGRNRSSLQPTVPSIVLAEDLPPSRFLEMDRDSMAGLALGVGSRTSHVSLLARARGLPLVVGLGALPAEGLCGDALLDADEGRLVLHPSHDTRVAAERRARMERATREQMSRTNSQPAITAAGEGVAVMINVDHPSVLEETKAVNFDGVGLTRTEFMFQTGAPNETMQLEAYSRILAWAGGRPVTIRTLDAGGDKPLPGITKEGETNPFLGVRGVRLSLKNEFLFKVQLRALLRASAVGPLKVMLPMVTDPAELDRARALLREATEELTSEGKRFGEPSLGMMVEVPVAALAAEEFDADFYSIGTNDLVQYATACARDNVEVAGLARGDHPGVIRLIQAVVAAGRQRKVEVSVCGDMASDPSGVKILLAAGVRALSVAPAQIGRVKETVRAFGSEN